MTAPPACVGEPLSWLLLERHALGELSEGEATRVRAHLTACAACAACADAAARSPAFVPARKAPARRPWWRRHAATWAATAAFACAAGAFLLLARSPDRPVAPGPTLSGVKGDDVALELVREREGVITHDAQTFAPGDRWKALVTCPVGGVMFWDLSVRDRTGVKFPLAPAGPIPCGNHVVLPGAFRLAGNEPAQVCVALSADPLPRPRAEPKPVTLGRPLCASLRPEP